MSISWRLRHIALGDVAVIQPCRTKSRPWKLYGPPRDCKQNRCRGCPAVTASWVGHPGGGDFYALRSIEVRLKGSRARFYNIFVKGRVTGGGGPIVETKGGEVLQATGTEFSARPASASGSGGFNLQT